MRCNHARIKWNILITISLFSLGFIYVSNVYSSGPVVPTVASSNSTVVTTKPPKKDADINYPISKTNLQTSFIFFERGYYYDSQGQIMDVISNEQKAFIQRAVGITAKKIDAKYRSFEFGGYRLLGNGLEFQLYFQGRNRTTSRKVSHFQHFGNGVHLNEIVYSTKKDVNIIVPLQGKLDALSVFLSHLVLNIVPLDSHIILTIVYFNDQQASNISSLLQKNFALLPSFRWNLVIVNDTQFSRGKGLKIGVEYAAKTPDQLVFFCDVDVLFKPIFLKRCRANAIENFQVYYPIVFSLYNPKIVYTLRQNKIPEVSEQLTVQEDNGFWRYFGYGMTCMCRREFDAAGGIPDLKSWGKEDEIFYNKIVALGNIKIIRYPDTGLFHIFHTKFCHNLSGQSYKSCVKSKAANEGSQMQLGVLLLKLQEGIHIEGVLYPGRSDYLRIIYMIGIGLVSCLFIIVLLSMSLYRALPVTKSF